MMSFVRERHSRNQLDGPGDNIDVFYDSIDGTEMIDAWVARLTNEDILQFQESFFGISIGASSFESFEKQGSFRKRADNESCERRSPISEAPSGAGSPVLSPSLAPPLKNIALSADIPTKVDESVPEGAATAVSSNEARLCVDECRAVFRQCTINYESIAEDRRRNVRLIDCQAAGNCYCTETPWRTGSPIQMDIDKADKICSDTCTTISQGTQARQFSGTKYSFEDLSSCLEQAEGDKLSGEAQPAG
ncbi:MAG: hypothetical protein Q9226_003531, partial [Calogaya cf. arnoldii]